MYETSGASKSMGKILRNLRLKKDLRILITRTDRIGDVVLSVPLIKILRKNFPQSYIAFMVRPYTKDLLIGNPYLNEVLIYDKYGEHKSFRGSLRFLRELKKQKFDLALILHPTNRCHLLCFFAKIPVRIGYDIKMGFLNNIKIPHLKHLGLKHELEYNLDFLKVLGIEYKKEEIEFYLPIKRESEERIENLFKELGIKEKDLIICINPTASCPSKIWRPQKFKELIELLIENLKAKVILIGSKDRIDICEFIEKNIKYKIINLCGMLSLADLISLLKRITVFVSCDSGPVHIANALGKKCVVIFGRNQPGLGPKRWAPFGEGHKILHKDVGCKECLAHNCKKRFLCLESITVDEVFKALLEILPTK